MQIKKLVVIALLFVVSISSIAILYLFSPKQNDHLNGFNRKVIATLPFSTIVDLKYNSYYIAGIARENIYLGNVTAPQLILTISRDGRLLPFKRIKEIERRRLFGAFNCIDSPFIYISDRSRYKLFYGNFFNDTLIEFDGYGRLFSEALPLHTGAYIIRGFKHGVFEYNLAKFCSYPPFKLIADSILEKQIDGMYCTDGSLMWDSKSSTVVYMYYYRNQFICMDTNLVVKFKARTIDTNTVAKIKVSNIQSRNSIVLSSPPAVVNKSAAVYNSHLFIESRSRADNEIHWTSNFVVAIDLYSVTTGQYEGSFYLSNPLKDRLKSFKVTDDFVAGLYEHSLILYNLRGSKNIYSLLHKS